MTTLAQDYFAIHVRDSQTGRGVPLVKLRANNQDYYTDSNGLPGVQHAGADESERIVLCCFELWLRQQHLAAADDARDTGHGATINRHQRAERLYRVTGKGIYQDTVLLGQTAPIDHPLLNANVKGQDSVQASIYNDQIHWFWGDTLYDVGFGNFRTSGATSQLPGQGGLDPSVGVNLIIMSTQTAPRSK